MTSRLRTFHYLLGAIMVSMLAVFVTTPQREWKTEKAPQNLPGLAQHIDEHPTDWSAAADITENALDADVPKRFELWHASHAFAKTLAPHREQSDIAFARSGLFHWNELTPDDRKRVIAAIDPLMRDKGRFPQLARPVWELTNDIALLRRTAPRDLNSLALIADIAVTNGDFNDYRAVRDDVRRERDRAYLETLRKTSPEDMLQTLRPPVRASEQATVQAMLDELHRRPLDGDPHAPENTDAVLAFVLDRNMEPLDGLEAVTRINGSASDPLRARLSLRLGQVDRATNIEISSTTVDPRPWRRYFEERAAFEEQRGDRNLAEVYRAKLFTASHVRSEWHGGPCEAVLCTMLYSEVEGPQTVTLEKAESDDVPPWVEVYIDDALVDEGPVDAKRAVTIPAGLHRVELRLANPVTRNLTRRRVRVS